jgi:transcriptional regulator with XRE-family HTH domain
VARYPRNVKAPWRSEAREGSEAARAFLRVGKVIRARRKALELSQEALAEKAGLSPQHIIDIEHGRTNPTLASLVGLARALELDLRDLFADV